MKDRVASSAGALQRLGIDMMFVNQIEEQILSGDDSGKSEFLMKCGQNKASLSTGSGSHKCSRTRSTVSPTSAFIWCPEMAVGQGD